MAFAVIMVTLMVQGMTLAPLARWLHLPRDDPQQDILAVAAVQHQATRKAKPTL